MAASLVAAGIGAGVRGLGTGVGAIARHLSKEGQAENKQNEEDIDALKRNSFGPSKAQQESTVQEAASMARAQAQAARAEAARQAAASGYRRPDTVSADISKAAQAQVGALRGQASDSAAQQARQAKLDALARVRARAAKTESDVAGVFGAAKEEYDAAGGLAGAGGKKRDYANLGKAYGGGA